MSKKKNIDGTNEDSYHSTMVNAKCGIRSSYSTITRMFCLSALPFPWQKTSEIPKFVVKKVGPPWQPGRFSNHSGHVGLELDPIWQSSHELPIWMFPKIGVPQNGWFIMENPIKSTPVWFFPLFTYSSGPLKFHLTPGPQISSRCPRYDLNRLWVEVSCSTLSTKLLSWIELTIHTCTSCQVSNEVTVFLKWP